MVRRGVLHVPSERNTTCGGVPPLVHDLNVPIEGTEEFEPLGASNSHAQVYLCNVLLGCISTRKTKHLKYETNKISVLSAQRSGVTETVRFS